MRRIGVCAYTTTSSLAKLALAAKIWSRAGVIFLHALRGIVPCAVFTVRPPTLLETRFTEQLFKIGQQKRSKRGCGCRWVAVAVAVVVAAAMSLMLSPVGTIEPLEGSLGASVTPLERAPEPL